MIEIKEGQVWRRYNKETGVERFYYVMNINAKKPNGEHVIEVSDQRGFTFLKSPEIFEELVFQYSLNPETGERE